MAENLKAKLKQLEVIKGTIFVQEDILPSSLVDDSCTVHLQEEILPSSTVEDSCTVYVTDEDAQMEYTDIKGEYLISNNI